jgi:hypothetical protein
MRHLLVLAAALMLTACPPSPPNNGNGGGGGNASPEQAFAEVMVGMCDAYRRCLNDTANGAAMRTVFLSFSEAQLQEILDPTACPDLLGRDSGLMEMYSAGRINIVPSKAQACIATIANQCSFMVDGPGDCGGFLEPMVEVGGICADGDECIGDADCTAQSGQCGECVASIALGEACDSNGTRCATGSTCDNQSGVCTELPAPAATGEACISDGFSFFAACADENDLCVDGTCKTYRVSTTAGETCHGDTTTVCGAGMLCSQGTCSSTVAADGDACMIDGDRTAFCGTSSYCRREELMSPCTPLLELGDRCEGMDQCVAGLLCDRNTSVCATKAANGEECTSTIDCASNTCDRDTGKCAPAYPETCE